MVHHRIAVGLDGTSAARQALAWAVREARRRGASLLLVTAWPDASRNAVRAGDALAAERRRLRRMQGDFLASATAAMIRTPAVALELVLGDPVIALCHAASRADLLVLGAGDRSRADSVGAAVTRRLAARTRHGEVVLVPSASPGRTAVWSTPPTSRPTDRTLIAV